MITGPAIYWRVFSFPNLICVLYLVMFPPHPTQSVSYWVCQSVCQNIARDLMQFYRWRAESLLKLGLKEAQSRLKGTFSSRYIGQPLGVYVKVMNPKLSLIPWHLVVQHNIFQLIYKVSPKLPLQYRLYTNPLNSCVISNFFSFPE